MSTVDEQPVVVMAWEDGGVLDGTEIAVVVTSAAATLAAEDFMARAAAGKPLTGKHMLRLAEAFIAHTVRWNRRDRAGHRLPVRLDAFLGMDRDLVWTVLRRWVVLVHSPPVADVAPPVEAPAPEPVEPDMADLLEARALRDPDDDQVQVEGPPAELVNA